MSLLKNILNISNHEWRPVVFSFCYYFCLMGGYFTLRPIRDEMGIQAGVENMQWLFTGTFVIMLLLVPLFGFLTKKVSRNRLVPAIYIFFALNILAFYIAFQTLESAALSMTFFIWLSVFNLFVISIFWSFNSDFFTSDQAKRLYGPITAGGSSGAIAGPVIATFFVGTIGVTSLLLISFVFMTLATLCAIQMTKVEGLSNERKLVTSMNGNIWEGLRLISRSPILKQICLFVLLYTTISTFLYFEQAHIISKAFSSSSDRTAYFGARDLLVNVFTLIFQFFLTGKIVRKWGVIFCLMLVPALSAFSFLSLSLSQSVYLLLVIQVVYGSLNFAVQRPTREMLFTSVTAEERYRSKNFIDTAVYRGGDAIGSWLFTGLSQVVGSLQIIAFVTIPIALTWVAVGFKAGKLFNYKTRKFHETSNEVIITKKSA
ncbi:MAG: MFS transporter [Cyclobacteriaceae bacterium]